MTWNVNVPTGVVAELVVTETDDVTLPPVDVNGLLPNTAAAPVGRPVSLAFLVALRVTVQGLLLPFRFAVDVPYAAVPPTGTVTLVGVAKLTVLTFESVKAAVTVPDELPVAVTS